jgi:hypothetical protein
MEYATAERSRAEADMENLVTLLRTVTDLRFDCVSRSKLANTNIATDFYEDVAHELHDHILPLIEVAISDMEDEHGLSREGATA